LALAGKKMASGNIKNFELRLKKLGLTIVIVGMAALLCFAFLLGVDVGKNIDTYPEQIAAVPRKVLAFIWRSAKIQTPQKVTEDKSQQEDSKDGENIDLTYHDTLTSKKGMAKEQPVAPKNDSIEAQPPQTTVSLAKSNEENSNVGANLEAQKKSAAVKETAKEESKSKTKQTQASTPANKNKFIIQAASLKEKVKAYQLNKKRAALGFEALIVPVEIKGKGTWYRVVISGFESKAQAQAAAMKISKKTGTNCIIRNLDSNVKKN
jgi:cell division protein FtsN